MPLSERKQVSFIDFLWANKIRLAIAIYIIFFIIYTICAAFGILPESLQTEPLPLTITPREIATTTAPIVQGSFIATATTSFAKAPEVKVKVVPKTTTKVYTQGGEDPVRVVIAKIGVNTKVSNPKSIATEVLNQYLQKGAVRYPGSAGLGAGNVFLFAHSTGLKVVNNQAYKAFNNFKSASVGDTVSVYSLQHVYTYKITKVRLAPADEIFIDLARKDNMLTLSTCNTFGAKEDRYVIEAAFDSVRPIDTDGI